MYPHPWPLFLKINFGNLTETNMRNSEDQPISCKHELMKGNLHK